MFINSFIENNNLNHIQNLNSIEVDVIYKNIDELSLYISNEHNNALMDMNITYLNEIIDNQLLKLNEHEIKFFNAYTISLIAKICIITNRKEVFESFRSKYTFQK